MNWLRWVLVASAIAKGLDAFTFNTQIALCWLFVAAALAINERAGALCLAAFALIGAGLDLRRMTNHVVLMGWIGLILGLWGDRATRLRLLRVQLVVVYAFAGLSKLNPTFLSGAYFEARQTGLPAPIVFAWLTIAIEWMLALDVWRRAPLTLPLAVTFHVALMSGWMVSLWRAGPGVLVVNTVLVAAVAVVTPWPSWQSRAAAQAPVSEPIILFDGVCGLCNWLVDFVLRRDQRAALRFQPLQAGAFGPTPDLDSVMVWHGARLYQESDAILYALAQLGGPWRMLRVLAAIPPSLRNAVYRFVARHRYEWFGRRDTCRIPTAAQRASFLHTELSGRP